MELVAFVGKDEENWGQITALMKRMSWDKVILVKGRDVEGFPEEGCEIVNVKSELPIRELSEDIKEKLKDKLSKEFEVALSIASGNGKEHMALISGLLNIPVGIKLVVFTKEGVQFLS